MNNSKRSSLSLILIILSIITLAAAAIVYFVGGGREKTQQNENAAAQHTVSITSGGKFVAAGDRSANSYDAPKTEFEVTVKGDKFELNGSEYDLGGLINELKKVSKPVAVVTLDNADEQTLKTMKTAFSGAGIEYKENSPE